MSDAVRVTIINKDGTSRTVTNEMDKSIYEAFATLDVCKDIVKSMDAVSFCSWIGAMVDEWAISHNMWPDSAEDMLDEIKVIARQVHQERAWEFPATEEEVPY